MKRILFIVNPIAGGKDKTKILNEIFDSLDHSLYCTDVKFTEYAGHATELAHDCEADVVVAIGGDGTQNEVARGLLGTGKAMGIIPCGSGDGLALHLGISRDPSKAARIINDGETAMMDYGLMCGHPFFCTTGMGIDANVSWRFAKANSRGLKTYVKESIKEWFHFKPDTYKIMVDGEEKWYGPATLVTIGNANQWGNNAKITPLASVADGLLDVTIVEKFNTSAFPGLLLRLMTGTADKSCHTVCLKGRSIQIERESDGPVHYDGDPYDEMGKSLDISIVPDALKVIVPADRKASI